MYHFCLHIRKKLTELIRMTCILHVNESTVVNHDNITGTINHSIFAYYTNKCKTYVGSIKVVSCINDDYLCELRPISTQRTKINI
jgi:hypothetical protein